MTMNSDERPAVDATTYWRKNLRYLTVLLIVWFVASFGCGILLRDALDSIRIPGTGFKLGFWFAQQGSMLVFVVLVFIYTRLMNRLDDRTEAASPDLRTPDSETSR